MQQSSKIRSCVVSCSWLRGKMAFTLIELLIVVAIIAILAAIAVPNFLEAQTRSKISRVKTDMRSMGVAFMAYYQDNNSVPPDSVGEVDRGNWGIENPGQQPDFKWRPGTEDLRFFGDQFFSNLSTPIAYITSSPHDAFTRRMPFAYDTYYETNFRYCVIASIGPDGYAMDFCRWNGLGTDMSMPYDPSNGTKSIGDIWRGMVILDQAKYKEHYTYEY
jgi:prepilin-type N-terminal cleavage/methylation domain-containing protein